MISTGPQRGAVRGRQRAEAPVPAADVHRRAVGADCRRRHAARDAPKLGTVRALERVQRVVVTAAGVHHVAVAADCRGKQPAGNGGTPDLGARQRVEREQVAAVAAKATTCKDSAPIAAERRRAPVEAAQRNAPELRPVEGVYCVEEVIVLDVNDHVIKAEDGVIPLLPGPTPPTCWKAPSSRAGRGVDRVEVAVVAEGVEHRAVVAEHWRRVYGTASRKCPPLDWV